MKEADYGVFIIESMTLDNEKDKKLDGFALKTILELCGIPNEYYYIRTKLELSHVMEKFKESNFLCLHISCHANKDELGLTFDRVNFAELNTIIGKYLFHRRLFLSACELTTFKLAQYFIPHYHCFSVIGSPDAIDYDKAAVFWSSYYYLMYNEDKFLMNQVKIRPILRNITKTFQLKLNYFSIINDAHPNSLTHLREINYENGEEIIDQARETEFINNYR